MRINTIVMATLLTLAAGCANSGGGGTVAPKGRADRGPAVKYSEFYRRYPEVGEGFFVQLLEPWTDDDGVKHPAGEHLMGIPKGDLVDDHFQWVLLPKYSRIYGTFEVAFVSRDYESRLSRIDLTKRPYVEESTPYDRIYLKEYTSDETGKKSLRMYGFTKDANRLTLLDEHGKELRVFDHVWIGGDGGNMYQSFDTMPGGEQVVIHHTDYQRPDGQQHFDRIYDLSGRAMSPELDPLWLSVAGDNITPGYRVVAVVVDPKREIYWPYDQKGNLPPKPDDLIGLQPIRWKWVQWTWRGWLAWWKTPEGERASFVGLDEFAKDGVVAILPSRAEAKWTEWVPFSWKYDNRVWSIRKAAGSDKYQVWTDAKDLAAMRWNTLDEAQKAIGAWQEADTKARLDREAAWTKQQQDERMRRDHPELFAREADAENASRPMTAQDIQKTQDAFDAAMASGDQFLARVSVLKLTVDNQRWTAYVKKYGIESRFHNTSQDVGYARAKIGGCDQAVLDKALRDLEASLPKLAQPLVAQPAAPTYQPPQSDWDYFWNGPRDGSQPWLSHESYQADPRLSYEGIKAQNEANRRELIDTYMRHGNTAYK